MKHHYKVTVERLSDHDDGAEKKSLQFCVENHDDILSLAERMKRRDDFPKESSVPFVVGLKLFSEVMLENRSHPLFSEFLPHFKHFMIGLKAGGKKERS